MSSDVSLALNNVRVPWCYWLLGGGCFSAVLSRFFEGQSVLPDYVAPSMQARSTVGVPQTKSEVSDTVSQMFFTIHFILQKLYTRQLWRLSAGVGFLLSPPDPECH